MKLSARNVIKGKIQSVKLGATTAHVCGLVAVQAGVAGLLGYLLALPVVLALRVGARQLGLEVVITPSFAAVVFAGSLLLCLGASLLTFRRIASIDPIPRYALYVRP